MSRPLISIITPVFNREALLAQCIGSILTQTLTDLEIVIVDDGSTDGTLSVARAFTDPRVRVIAKDHGGVAAARNVGMDAARGSLIAWFDSDDHMFPAYLESLLAVWQSNPDGVATSNAYYLGSRGGLSRRQVRHRGRFPQPAEQRLALLQSNYVSPMSLFDSSVVEEIGHLDESLTHGEDWDFWLRIALSGRTFAHQAIPLALMRRGHASLTTDTKRMREAERTVLAGVASGHELSAEEDAYLTMRRQLGEPGQHIDEAHAFLAAGSYMQAARSLRTAAKLAPAEGPLKLKARLLSLAPSLIGPVLRRRDTR